MNKMRITFEIKSDYKKGKRTSEREKLVNAFIRLASRLRPYAIAKLLQLTLVLAVVAYIICRALTLILNRL